MKNLMPNTVIKAYKVRNKNNGLFWCGGIDPKYTKYGKTFSRLSHVKLAIINKTKHLSRYQNTNDAIDIFLKEHEIYELIMHIKKPNIIVFNSKLEEIKENNEIGNQDIIAANDIVTEPGPESNQN